MRCALFMQLTEMVCIVQIIKAYQNSAQSKWSASIQQQNLQEPQKVPLEQTANSPYLSTSSSPLSYWSDTIRCFSCMSPIYEAAWSELQHVYYAPRNFTKLCNLEHIDAYSVRSVACQTVCIRMTEVLVIGGLRIRANIRGCMDDILRGGFNKTVINRHRWYQRDSCNHYQKRVLFQLPAEKSDDSSINLCVCYGDYCNGATSSSVRSTEAGCKILFLLYCLFLVLTYKK